MKLVVKSGIAAALHADGQNLAGIAGDAGCLVLPVPDGTPVEIGRAWLVNLDAAKASVCDAIDAEAERRRGAVLTPGAGQMAAYQEKERQALACLEADVAEEADYPDLINEIGVTADTLAGVAQAVMQAAAAWRVFGRAVERARLAGKKAVAEAGDVAGVLAARDGVVWPESA